MQNRLKIIYLSYFFFFENLIERSGCNHTSWESVFSEAVSWETIGNYPHALGFLVPRGNRERRVLFWGGIDCEMQKGGAQGMRLEQPLRATLSVGQRQLTQHDRRTGEEVRSAMLLPLLPGAGRRYTFQPYTLPAGWQMLAFFIIQFMIALGAKCIDCFRRTGFTRFLPACIGAFTTNLQSPPMHLTWSHMQIVQIF